MFLPPFPPLILPLLSPQKLPEAPENQLLPLESVENNSEMTEDQKAHYLSRVTTKSPFTPAPKTRKEMLRDPFVNEYVMAEKEEVANLASLGTFEMVRRSSLPRQAKTLKCKWVYADKLDRDGSIVKLKARLTAMGCFQREGIDYHETFASVARTKTFRVLMSIYNLNASYTCEHWDVKNAFVNAPIEEEIWIEQPDGHDLLESYTGLRWGGTQVAEL